MVSQRAKPDRCEADIPIEQKCHKRTGQHTGLQLVPPLEIEHHWHQQERASDEGKQQAIEALAGKLPGRATT